MTRQILLVHSWYSVVAQAALDDQNYFFFRNCDSQRVYGEGFEGLGSPDLRQAHEAEGTHRQRQGFGSQQRRNSGLLTLLTYLPQSIFTDKFACRCSL